MACPLQPAVVQRQSGCAMGVAIPDPKRTVGRLGHVRNIVVSQAVASGVPGPGTARQTSQPAHSACPHVAPPVLQREMKRFGPVGARWTDAFELSCGPLPNLAIDGRTDE